MMDLDFGSKNLRSLIDTCAQLSNHEPKQSEVYPIGVIKNANQGFLNSFRTKINQISQRFKTFAKDIGDFVIKSISKVEKVISETVGKVLPETIARVLTELSEKFLDFVGILLERMFTFLSQFGPLANRIGYSLSEVEIKLPTIQIQQVSIIPGLAIPLPTIAPPDITIKIKSLKGE